MRLYDHSARHSTRKSRVERPTVMMLLPFVAYQFSPIALVVVYAIEAALVSVQLEPLGGRVHIENSVWRALRNANSQHNRSKFIPQIACSKRSKARQRGMHSRHNYQPFEHRRVWASVCNYRYRHNPLIAERRKIGCDVNGIAL